MLKAFGKLTKSKSLPPSTNQVLKHKEQRRQAGLLRDDVQALRVVLDTLGKDYESHKGDFAIGRYEELKTMIKAAVKQCQDVVTEKSKRAKESVPAGGKGPVTSLQKNLETFAKRQQDTCSEEKEYSEMSSKGIDDDLNKLRREILSLKEEFRQLRECFEKLGKDYEDSKRLNPTQRYKVMKDLVKDMIQSTAKISASLGS